MKVAIVGLGLIGGSLGKDLQGLGWATEIFGIDTNTENAQMALKLKLVHKILPLNDAIAKTQLIILATPVDHIVELLPQVLNRVSENTFITDMGSTKEALCYVASKNSKRDQFVACHPMAGTENSGPGSAIAGLFTHKTAVICEKEKSKPEAIKVVESMLHSLKMRIVYMNPQDHDLHAAYVSHLSHISSFVLANTVLDKEKDAGTIFDLAGGGFESTVRLAKSSPSMWSPIFMQNKKHVSQALADYIEHLKHFKASIDSGEKDQSLELMEGANEIRRVLDQMAQRGKK